MSSTPQEEPTSTTSGQGQSPMTRRAMSSIQKNNMADLNDRLAAYIGRIQHLEHENQSSSKMISQLQEDADKRMTRVKNEYETQVLGLQTLVDETAKDKNKLSNHFDALKKDYDYLKSKFEDKGEDYQDAQRNLLLSRNFCTELQQQLTRTGSECDQLLTEKKNFEAEVAELSREVGNLRGDLDHESFARVAIEDQLRHKKEELQFIKNLYEKEVDELKTSRQDIRERDGQLQQEYELKVQQSLQELRSEYETKLNANKEEMKNLYDQKNLDLGKQLKRTKSSLASKIKEITELQEKLDASSQTLDTFEEERVGLLRKIKEMENKSDHDHAIFAKMLDERDGDIDSLMKEKADLMFQYQELKVSKVAMDNEISTYRKLLETEEKRMNMSPRFAKREATPAVDGRKTKKRRLEGDRETKKRRIEEDVRLVMEDLCQKAQCQAEINLDNKVGDID